MQEEAFVAMFQLACAGKCSQVEQRAARKWTVQPFLEASTHQHYRSACLDHQLCPVHHTVLPYLPNIPNSVYADFVC